MQHLAPPQYSPDGRWWWNGRAWVRVNWPVQTWDDTWDERASEEEPRRRRTPAVLWVGVIALLALLVLAFGATLVSWFPLQGLGVGGQAVPSAPAAPAAPAQATPAPTATPQDGAAAGPDAYRQVVTSDAARFQTAGQNVADRCAPGALGQGTGDCRAALQSMDDAVQRFQADLAGTTVPACLQPADAELRTALNQYHQGIRQELDGIDHQDLGAISQGAGTLSDATGHAQSAAALLQNSC
jgi:hypothetical protein